MNIDPKEHKELRNECLFPVVLASQKHPPPGWILYQNEVGMIFHKNMIVMGKTMNGNKVFLRTRKLKKVHHVRTHKSEMHAMEIISDLEKMRHACITEELNCLGGG
jgi:hypothetical protein